MQASARLERAFFAAFVLLTAGAAFVVARLPLLPGHDVPQHLAYVRLLATWRADPASFPAVYATPDTSSGYATAYAILARLAPFGSPESALRACVALYVVALAFAVRALVRAAWTNGQPGHEYRREAMTALVAPLLALNPVLCMGLLAYLFALPAVVFAFAAVVRYLRSASRAALGATFLFSAAASALHAVAVAALVFTVGALLVARRDRRAAVALVATVAGAVVGARLVGSGAALPPGLGATLLQNVRMDGIFRGTVETFHVSFTNVVEKLDQIAASVVGPFPLAGKVLAALVVGALLLLDHRWKRREANAELLACVPGVRLAVFALAIFAIVAPAALQVPDDLSLLDFRLITTATILAIVLIRPGILTKGRLAIFAAGISALLLLWARQLGGAAEEVQQTVRLVDRLGPDDRLLALSMHDASAFLDERNSILHYAAVYHTVHTGGVTSLFWGKFSPRLPVGYRPDRVPPSPADWSPWELTDEQLTHYTHVVVRWPTEIDEPELHALAHRIGKLQEEHVLEPIGSDGPCVLFAITRRPAGALALRP